MDYADAKPRLLPLSRQAAKKPEKGISRQAASEQSRDWESTLTKHSSPRKTGRTLYYKVISQFLSHTAASPGIVFAEHARIKIRLSFDIEFENNTKTE